MPGKVKAARSSIRYRVPHQFDGLRKPLIRFARFESAMRNPSIGEVFQTFMVWGLRQCWGFSFLKHVGDSEMVSPTDLLVV